MNFALFISSLFEPMVVIYVLAIVGGKQANLPTDIWATYTASITIFFVLVFAIRLFFKHKDHTNWDISERKKRFVPLSVLTLFFGVLSIVVRTLGNPVLTSLFFSMFLWCIGFVLITLKVKLSGHVGILTFAIGQLYIWYGGISAPLFILIPLLSWSRLYLKRHTVQEVLAGILYSSILFLLSNRIIG